SLTSSRTDISQCPQVMPVTWYSLATIGYPPRLRYPRWVPVREQPYTPGGYSRKPSTSRRRWTLHWRLDTPPGYALVRGDHDRPALPQPALVEARRPRGAAHRRAPRHARTGRWCPGHHHECSHGLHGASVRGDARRDWCGDRRPFAVNVRTARHGPRLQRVRGCHERRQWLHLRLRADRQERPRPPGTASRGHTRSRPRDRAGAAARDSSPTRAVPPGTVDLPNVSSEECPTRRSFAHLRAMTLPRTFHDIASPRR